MKLSVVVPCYNDKDSLEEFYDSLTKKIKEEKISYELVMVDDGSSDDTLNILKSLADKDKNVKVISFSRNFGKESAMLAGLEYAKGDYIAIMDADLQHTPEVLFNMYEKLISEPLYDVVCAYQENRSESKLKKVLISLFYRINNKLSDVKMLPGASDFRIFKKSVKDAIISLTENNRFLKGIFSWVGFNTIYVPYTPEKRLHGTSKWSIYKLIKYSVDGLISFSNKPLRIIFIIGIISFVVGLVNFLLVGNLSHRTIILFLSFVLLFIAVIALYIIKMYNTILKRPNYIIKEKINL